MTSSANSQLERHERARRVQAARPRPRRPLQAAHQRGSRLLGRDASGQLLGRDQRDQDARPRHLAPEGARRHAGGARPARGGQGQLRRPGHHRDARDAARARRRGRRARRDAGAVAAFELDAADAALGPEAKLAEAREILFNDKYDADVASIMGPTKKFEAKVNERTVAAVEDAQASRDRSARS